MKIENQEKVWDNIAKEWNEYKKIPSQLSEEFLKTCQGNILDLGSGSGRHLTKIKKGKMFLIDFSQEMLKLAEKKAKKQKVQIETKQGDLFKIPYEDDFFDNAICISALHCIKPDKHKKSVQEIYRVMKPKSKSLIGVWNFHSKRFNQKQGKEKLIKWTDKGERYYYLFEEKEVHKLFKDIGFKILSTHNSEMMINFIVEKI
jgi:ubiquinone/menaquinone biosynthesis C-methylase UbiE